MYTRPKYYKVHTDGHEVAFEPIYEELVPVVRGRWEDYREGVAWGFPYLCSNCHKAHDYKEPYCPNCGAKMK